MDKFLVVLIIFSFCSPPFVDTSIEDAEDDITAVGGISSIFLNTQPYPSPSSAFSRRTGNRNRQQTSPVLRSSSSGGGGNNNDNNHKETVKASMTIPPSPAPPNLLSSQPPPSSPIVAQIKMEIDSASIKNWPAKWWGCTINSNNADQTTQTSNVGTAAGAGTVPLLLPEDSAAAAEELLISSQIENLVLKAHIAIRAELLAATATNYPPPTLIPPSDGDDSSSNSATETASSEPIWTKAEFKVLEIFRFSDLRGKAKPFLDAYTNNGRVAVSFRPTPALIASGMTEDSECFSSMLSFPSSSGLPPSVVITQNNMLRKRNIKIGLTYLLFIAITSGNSNNINASTMMTAPVSTSVPLANSNSNNNNEQQLLTAIDLATPAASSQQQPMSQQLHYSLLAPPLVFHKRFRHSIYNVLCTDCTNAPLIKQLSVKFNSSTGVLSAYCLSPAHPIPTFVWTLDGRQLRENDASVLTDFEPTLKIDKIRSTRKNSKIEISGIQEKRAHTLTCGSENHFGHSTLSQPFAIQGNKMSMLLLKDEHDRALNINTSGIGYESDLYATTTVSSFVCLGDIGRQALDWAFMNPWISVFIGLACVIVFLAISLLILKCVLRARFHSVSRHSGNKCPHHHQHHHERSPSLNGGGTIVIDSSCNGDDCITTSGGSGRNYHLTAESKVPLLGKSSNHSSLPRRVHSGKQTHQFHNNQLAVMVGNVTPPNDAGRGVSPGSGVSGDDKTGPMAPSSNSTTSSSAGGVSLTAQQRGNANTLTPGSVGRNHQVHTTFRNAQAVVNKQGPPTAPRNSAMTQSWHSQTHDVKLVIDGNNNTYHLPNCPQVQSHYPPPTIQPPEIPPQTYLYSITTQPQNNQQTLLIRQQAPPLPPPPPELESDVIVKLLPALSAASSLAEFLGHENEHIEVVPEVNEDQLSMSSESSLDDEAGAGGVNNRIMNDGGGPVMSIDSDDEIDQRRNERRGFLDVLEQIDNETDDNNANKEPQSSSPSDSLTSNDKQQVQQQQQQQNYIMSSSQNTAIFRPLQMTTSEH